MRACPACGASNDPTDDFCGNCGTYLGWSDTPSAPSRATTPADPAPEGPPAVADHPTPPAATEPTVPPEDPATAPERPAAAGSGPGSTDASAAAGPVGSAADGVPDRSGASVDPGRRAARPAAAESGTGQVSSDASAAAGPAGPAAASRGSGRPTAAEPETGRIPDAPSAAVPATPALPVSLDPPAVPAPPALPDVIPPGVSGAALAEGGPLSAARALGASLRARLTGRGSDEASAPDTPAADAADADDTARTDQGPGTSEGQGATPSRPATTGPSSPSAPGAAPRTGSRAPASGDPLPTTPRPPAPPAPAADPAPVGPVLPAKPVAPRPVVRPTTVEEGDVVGRACPVCGTVNRPERRFCRRCAAELKPAEKPAPLPWWRTVWPFRRRRRAGSGSVFRFVVILAVVLALCAGGFLLLPAGRALIEDTRDKLGKATPITPVAVEASAAVRGHPAADTTDGLNNRYWGAPGPGASVTYTFRKPFRLVDLIITNGASTSPEAYARQGRALQVDLEVTAEDGTEHRKEITLSDKPGPQTISTGISDAKSVRLVLSSPAGLTSGRHLAVAEVEFFQRS
ncbi:NADase-type glycan-binding domain-containing protein [Streptomyces sp. NPDC014676]|uniref:zinc ribbon domain-containing protein n=1 Tax=Streptomyces sp. NPDC014676 TaxID=3364879 RepID=UPI0036F7E0F4